MIENISEVPDRSTRRRRGSPLLAIVERFVSVLAVLAAMACPLVAQEADSAGDSVESSPVPEVTPVDPELPQRNYQDGRARTQVYEVGVMMIGAILIAGVGLITLVMIWGNRLRRIARQPLPNVAPRDELWFLKHKKGNAASTSEHSSADEGGE